MTAGAAGAQKSFTVTSPDGRLRADVALTDKIEYSVSHDGAAVLAASAISMDMGSGGRFGENPRLLRSSRSSVSETIKAPVYKKSEIKDEYNELTLTFRGGYNVIFRVYDEAVAYRFQKTTGGAFTVYSEQASFAFPQDSRSYIAYVASPGGYDSYESQLWSAFENVYTEAALSEWDPGRLAMLPVLVDAGGGMKVCITEADLLDYPGMYLCNPAGSARLEGYFAPYPASEEQGGHNMLETMVLSREDFIAKGEGPALFPWRVAIVSTHDAELADNDTVYKLASPAEGDFSWVRPGKVAWEWWNSSNLYGVDFETGINNETYKYYIDFASEYGIEYVILDEGWAVNLAADLMRVVPEIDLEMLAAYGAERNVALILWAGYLAFDRDMESVCRHYSEMGIKGFKVDFMDRDDQKMVAFHRRAAETAARYGLLLDFHGTYKPTGLQRTYPNVVNFEGVYGLENMKVADAVDQVSYDVTVPFIRQVAGPMDYTQGAMRNASRENYRAVFTEPMSQGTRCRQLAQYVIFESPLNMLCDSPSNYMREDECARFIAAVPTVWDETRVLEGKVGEYIAIARRKGDEWYVGAMTGWDERLITIDISFAGEGNFNVDIFCDGPNAVRAGRDYRRITMKRAGGSKIPVRMAPGGGVAMRIVRE